MSKEIYKPCPKCKSREGYTFTLIVEYNQWVDLCGEGIDAEHNNEDNVGKIMECVHCHTRFRRSTLEVGK